ncbi:malonyl-CoA decarboxylase, mitochondrial [Galendromus occidentalis]|uniref:Malonyl-CoA decarboxylase, mitochondrial n=1 Tax=Galendromus occidentalis TaxID=34638 RepID=A0AAJ7L6I8_9ACAR|nr:malonyl-CoA decarboxylase, mitochondrial [Galendromus occidentalis]
MLKNSLLLLKLSTQRPMDRLLSSSIERLLKDTLLPKDPRAPQNSQLVSELCRRYLTLSEDDQMIFMQKLATDFDVDRRSVCGAAQGYLDTFKNEDPKDIPIVRLEEKLRQALTPKYMDLFQQIGKVDGGVKFLVDLRGHMLDILAKNANSDLAGLRTMSNQLKELLSVWFSAGLMKVERITWQSSCQMLQKISEYEAVHPVRGWLDLKRRVGPYRRCFVFCHSTMPNEPIVVLHTALMQHVAESIKEIVQHQQSLESTSSLQAMALPSSMENLEEPSRINAAIFYSITSTQKGLQGIELGRYLIKNAVQDLQAEHPSLSTFSTLSPIPGFRDWILTCLAQASRKERSCPFTVDELETITEEEDAGEATAMLYEMIKSHLWYKNETLKERLKEPLMRLCAQYLFREKHRGFALNGVANFHLKNGATLWRINWMADTSLRGLNNSCSLMVNYRYFLDSMGLNSAQYCIKGDIDASSQVLAFAAEQMKLDVESSL